MIIRPFTNGYICIQQHDHAKLSGWLAASWGNTRVPPNDTSQNALVLATAMHDIGWVQIDAEPHWNESKNQPSSFQDEPIARRVNRYTNGIDQVAQEDPYAALLCSRHYTSFFSPENLAQLGEPAITFVAHEKKRQVALAETLSNEERGAELARADYDLTLLKLWDHISLFVGLNTPGASKAEEHPWYREGFQPIYLSYPDYKAGDPSTQVSFQACWLDTRQISLEPFPFPRPLTCILPYRQVMLEVIDAIGYPAAYQHALPQTQIIQFIEPK